MGLFSGSEFSKKSENAPLESYSLENVLDGEWVSNNSNEVFIVTKRYPLDHKHGNVNLSEQADLHLISQYAKNEKIHPTSLDKLLFLDTEATGLYTGVGTYTFLIGTGKFTPDCFEIKQFFLREPGEEISQLTTFEEYIAGAQTLVTYNGKAFDLPLLTTRFIFNLLPSPVNDLYHIDLLHLARRLWKLRLPSRTLGNIETFILEFQRSGMDIPGWMIPDLYYDYLHTNDARPLQQVFYHNEIDVLSMAALLIHISQMLTNPLDHHHHSLDILSIAKLYADLGHIEYAIRLYNHALEHHQYEDQHALPAIKHLAALEKRRQNYNAAITWWKLAAEKGELYAYIELAKVYEHVHKDYSQAIQWVEQCQNLIETSDIKMDSKLSKDLSHRHARLCRKLNAQ